MLIPNQTQEKIIELYKLGHGLDYISKATGVSKASVTNVRRRHGLTPNIIKVSDSEAAEILKVYDKLQHVGNTAKAVGRNRNAVSKVLKRLGVQNIHENSVRQKTIVKYNLFEDLSSDKVQYFIGLLAADGCIYKESQVSLGLADRELIDEFCNFSGVTTVQTYADPRYPNSRPIHSMRFTNRECVDTLKQYGITARKSSTLRLEIPITFPIFRGYFDGNGSIVHAGGSCIYLSVCTASENLAAQLRDFLSGQGYKTTQYKTQNNFKVRLGGKSQMLRIYEDMYKDATVYLNRKKQKFDLIR